jgi:hypothetical protein
VAAALAGARLRDQVRLAVARGATDPASILADLDAPADLVLAWAAPAERVVRWARAGAGSLHALVAGSGVLADPEGDQGALTLESGQTLVACSPGVTASTDGRGAAFGMARLRDVLGSLAAASPQAILDAVSGAVTAFSAEGAHGDLAVAAVRLPG